VVTELRIVGGDPALDLANTAGDDRVPDPLADYGDFVAWAARAGVIDDPTAARLAERGRERPAAAERAVAEARELRALVDAVFRPLATADDGPRATAADRPSPRGDRPPPEALARLVARAGAAVERARLVPVGDGFVLTWESDHLERPLWTLAAAAVDLLRTGPLDRLKVCVDCAWLFIDTSRNRSRRWCSMDVCGAHAKMRRYRARRATAGR
jgi:predicted RNA-binding Zn ribbon-like protein